MCLKSYLRSDKFYDVSDLLLRSGANVDISNGRGDTPAHLASRNGLNEALRLLIENKADINVQVRSI